VSSPVPVPLEAHDPDRARILKLRIRDRVSDVRRHLVALRTAMAEFGEDFDLDAFQRAYESDDPVVLNRVKAVERGVDQLYNFIAELAAFGLELAEVRVRREETNAPADIDALARIGVIGPKRAASPSASTTPTGTGSPAASAPRATSDLMGRLRTAWESSASVCPRIAEATRERACSRGSPSAAFASMPTGRRQSRSHGEFVSRLLLRLLTSERTAGRPERRDKSCWLRFPVGLPPPPLGCARLRGGRHGRLRPVGGVQ
jgi:hypothetical protein